MGRILVVDDDPRLLSAIKSLLTEEGYQVATASSAEDALDYLQSQAPDVVVLDVYLPGINGLEACRRIKYKHPALPVIIMSGQDERQSAMAAGKLGATDFVGKPFDPAQMLETIQRAAGSNAAMGSRPGPRSSPPAAAVRLVDSRRQRLAGGDSDNSGDPLRALNEALQFDDELAKAYNHLAWLHATYPDTALRDPQTAVRHAQKACELAGYRQWDYLRTMAVAQAAAGNFRKAVQWMQRALELAPPAQHAACIEMMERWLGGAVD
jgi:DNA-binding response OmpR family regulator